MFTSLAITALLASSVFVRADPSPNTPGTNSVYNAGAQCPIAWGADSTGVWKTMNIQLMTGDNFNMVPLTTVTTVDGTNPSTNTFSWTCPEVNPNSAIYFYQFTSPASNNTLWTTRFAIASDSGATTPPAKTTQPDGEAIPWGTGALVNAADANPPPTAGATSVSVSGTVPNATTSVSSTPTTASSSVLASSSSSPAGTTPSTGNSNSGTTAGGASSSSGSAASSSVSAASNANAAMAALSVDVRIFQAMVTLGVAAIGFTVLL